MSAAACGPQLVQATKELSLEWERTRAHWRDAKSLEFEKQYLAELPHHIARAVEAIEEINALLNKIRSDCEQPH